MREERLSINLRQLNKDYLDLYFNPAVKRAVRRKKSSFLKQIGIILYYIKNKRFLELKSKILERINRSTENKVAMDWGIRYQSPSPDTDFGSYKVAVYTCIFGNYAEIQEPMYCNPYYDYYVITDNENYRGLWKKYNYKALSCYDGLKNMEPREKNRWFKLHPHLLFPDYQYSVYLDGRIQLISDVMPMIDSMNDKILGVHLHATGMDCVYEAAKAVIASQKAPKDMVISQMAAYKMDGYPMNHGLFENGFLIRKHNDKRCKRVMEDWWEQLVQFTIRDQLSLNYILWKNRVDKNQILILGNNIYKNPYFRFAEFKI